MSVNGLQWMQASVLFFAALTGCYSFSTMARARTLPARRVEAWVAPEALIVATDTGAATRPIGEVGIRYGATPWLELDARISTFGATAGPRFQLRRSASLDTGLDIALAPAFAYAYPDKLGVELPVLFGINLPGHHQLVVAPRLAYQAHVGVGGVGRTLNYLYVGGSVGFAWQIADRIALFPEVALLTQIYADPGFSSNVSNALGIQAGVGVLFDP